MNTNNTGKIRILRINKNGWKYWRVEEQKSGTARAAAVNVLRMATVRYSEEHNNAKDNLVTDGRTDG